MHRMQQDYEHDDDDTMPNDGVCVDVPDSEDDFEEYEEGQIKPNNRNLGANNNRNT